MKAHHYHHFPVMDRVMKYCFWPLFVREILDESIERHEKMKENLDVKSRTTRRAHTE